MQKYIYFVHESGEAGLRLTVTSKPDFKALRRLGWRSCKRQEYQALPAVETHDIVTLRHPRGNV